MLLGRRQIFHENLKFMVNHNSQPGNTYFTAPNHFMDMSNKEFRTYVKGTKVGVLMGLVNDAK